MATEASSVPGDAPAIDALDRAEKDIIALVEIAGKTLNAISSNDTNVAAAVSELSSTYLRTVEVGSAAVHSSVAEVQALSSSWFTASSEYITAAKLQEIHNGLKQQIEEVKPRVAGSNEAAE